MTQWAKENQNDINQFKTKLNKTQNKPIAECQLKYKTKKINRLTNMVEIKKKRKKHRTTVSQEVEVYKGSKL